MQGRWYHNQNPSPPPLSLSLESKQEKHIIRKPQIYHSANAATAAAPRLTSADGLPRTTGAALAVFCAGALVVPDAPAPRVAVPDAAAEEPEPVPEPLPLPPVVPEPEPEPVPEPVPVPLPAAWPGLRFSVAFAASAEKADIVFSPDAGLLGGISIVQEIGWVI